jgi:hypothetical protein
MRARPDAVRRSPQCLVERHADREHFLADAARTGTDDPLLRADIDQR